MQFLGKMLIFILTQLFMSQWIKLHYSASNFDVVFLIWIIWGESMWIFLSLMVSILNSTKESIHNFFCHAILMFFIAPHTIVWGHIVFWFSCSFCRLSLFTLCMQVLWGCLYNFCRSYGTLTFSSCECKSESVGPI